MNPLATPKRRDIKYALSPKPRIYILDFLNAIRRSISYVPGAKFTQIETFIASTKEIAINIFKNYEFTKLFIVMKSFKFNEKINYYDLPIIVLWTFHMAYLEYSKTAIEFPAKCEAKICLVLAKGFMSDDPSADDRGVFILCDWFNILYGERPIILSHDKYSDIIKHYYKQLKLIFYWLKEIGKEVGDCELSSNFMNFVQQPLLGSKSFIVQNLEDQSKKEIILDPL